MSFNHYQFPANETQEMDFEYTTEFQAEPSSHESEEIMHDINPISVNAIDNA